MPYLWTGHGGIVIPFSQQLTLQASELARVQANASSSLLAIPNLGVGVALCTPTYHYISSGDQSVSPEPEGTKSSWMVAYKGRPPKNRCGKSYFFFIHNCVYSLSSPFGPDQTIFLGLVTNCSGKRFC
jgi:hypothetical protein